MEKYIQLDGKLAIITYYRGVAFNKQNEYWNRFVILQAAKDHAENGLSQEDEEELKNIMTVTIGYSYPRIIDMQLLDTAIKLEFSRMGCILKWEDIRKIEDALNDIRTEMPPNTPLTIKEAWEFELEE